MNSSGYLSVEQLRKDVAEGKIDTVVVVMTDMQGRLVGKRIHGQFFLDEDRKSTRLNSSHSQQSRMPSSA